MRSRKGERSGRPGDRGATGPGPGFGPSEEHWARGLQDQAQGGSAAGARPQGYDVTEAREGATHRVVATPGRRPSCRARAWTSRSSATSAARPPSSSTRASSATTAATTSTGPTGTTPYVGRDASGKKRLTLYQELRRAGQRAPEHRQGRGRRPHDQRRADPGAEGHAQRAQPARRHAPGGPLLLHAARARVDHARARTAASPTTSSTTTQEHRGRHDRHAARQRQRAVVRASSSTPTATTSPSRPATGCGARTCATTTATARSRTATASTPTATSPTKWNYDHEGSSSDPAIGDLPRLRPGLRARDPGHGRPSEARSTFKFQINYHSSAELILYPVGWQVETPSADDPIFAPLSGTDDNPAIDGKEPGAPDDFDPDVSAELYTTNGETNDTATGRYKHARLDARDGRLRPRPRRRPSRSSCSRTRRGDLQAAFEKNLPFALDVAKSAKDPANPVAHLGNDGARLRADDLRRLLRRPADGRGQRQARARHGDACTTGQRRRDAARPRRREWQGGERYGGAGVYFHRLRGEVSGTKAGDKVKVWFSRRRASARTRSPTTLKSTSAATGCWCSRPRTTPASRTRPTRASRARTTSSTTRRRWRPPASRYDVYDVDANGRTAPDRSACSATTRRWSGTRATTFRPRARGSRAATGTSKLADDEIIASRDYLNEGGKLLYTGQNAGVRSARPALRRSTRAGQPPYCKASDTLGRNGDQLRSALQRLPPVLPGGVPASDAAASKDGRERPAAAPGRRPVRHDRVRRSTARDSRRQPGAHVTRCVDHLEHPAQDRPTRSSRRDAGGPARPAAGLRPAGRPVLRGRQEQRRVLPAPAPDDRPHGRDVERGPVVQALLRHRAGLRLRLRRGPHRRARTTGRRCPTPTATPATMSASRATINWDTLHPFLAHYQTNINKSQDAEDADCTHGTGTTRRVERGDRQLGRLPGLEDRPERVTRASRSRSRSPTPRTSPSRASACSSTTSQVDRRTARPPTQTSFEDDLGGLRPARPPAGTETTPSGSARSPSASSSARASPRRHRSTGASASRV